MHSLRSHEGVLTIDHRQSPGVPDAVLMPMGFDRGAGSGLFESATFTCPYCSTVVVMNPKRTRARNYDPKTNHLVCDPCEAVRKSGVTMKTMRQLADEAAEAAAKGSIIIP